MFASIGHLQHTNFYTSKEELRLNNSTLQQHATHRVTDNILLTKNAVEAWHRAFQGTGWYVHVQGKIMEAIRIHQSHTEIFFWIHNGQHRPTKNTKTKHKEEAFSSLTP